MSSKDDHGRPVESFPEDVRVAHEHSSCHREEILASARCGCFSCCALFAPADIHEWVDAEDDGPGLTALCPKCRSDSVLGDASGFPITDAFMKTMKAHWG